MEAVLRNEGVEILHGVFPAGVLELFRRAADACFQAIAQREADLVQYRFTPFSQSVSLAALLDFGVPDLLAPLHPAGITELASQALRAPVECSLADSWLRKRFAPCNAPRYYQPNSWHQDGGLRAAFGADSATVGPMTRLLTCWIPLQDCGIRSPGLEFVRHPLDTLLHYSELRDSDLRQRFAPESFWAPELRLGDGVLLQAGTLHRTHVLAGMRHDRLSLEYRFL